MLFTKRTTKYARQINEEISAGCVSQIALMNAHFFLLCLLFFYFRANHFVTNPIWKQFWEIYEFDNLSETFLLVIFHFRVTFTSVHLLLTVAGKVEFSSGRFSTTSVDKSNT